MAIVLGAPAILAALYAVRANFDETAAVDGATTDGGDRSESGSKATSRVDSLGALVGQSKHLFAGSFVLVFVAVVCSGLYYRGVLTFLPELLRGLPGFEPVPIGSLLPAGVGSALGVEPGGGQTLSPEDYFYAGLLLVGVVGQYVGGKLTERYPVENAIAVAFGVLVVIALLFVPVSGMGILPLAILGAVLGVFLFVVQPLYQAAVAEYTPSGTRGLSYGFTYLAVFGVGALGGTIAGTILAYGSVAGLFLTLAAFAAIASAIGVTLRLRRGA